MKPLPLLPALLTLLAPDAPAQTTALSIDPRLIAETAEVWAVLGAEENPIWPGWDALATPRYFYFPGVQELLIGHPAPPAGWRRYQGPLSFGTEEIWVHDGQTEIDFDGQNTTRTIAGVQCLVVADTLSNLRMNLELIVRDEAPVAERVAQLDHARLCADPYSQMGMIAHEAFHAFQSRWIGARADVEQEVLRYPVLGVENNVLVALEGEALAAALSTQDIDECAEATLAWLGVRQARRAGLEASAIRYEDGIELNEGLARYVEWRLSEVLEGRVPGPGMAWVSSFSGYADLSHVRKRLIEGLLGSHSGERLVNNDPYGTGMVRFRLYDSGMAIAALLDRLLPEWKERIVASATSLTALIEYALQPEPELTRELARRWLEHPRRPALEQRKRQLAEEGRKAAERRVRTILEGESTLLCLDYSAQGQGPIGWGFTPFGITAIDADRTIYAVTPVTALFSDGAQLRQTVASPLLHDASTSSLCCQLQHPVTASDLALELDREGALDLELPGLHLQAPRARVTLEGKRLRIALLPQR